MLDTSEPGAPQPIPHAVTVLMINLLPIICSFFSGIMYISPWRRIQQIIREKTTADLTPIPYFSMMTSAILWATYGIQSHNTSILLINSFGVICAAYYCNIFYKYSPPQKGVKQLILVDSVFILCVLLYVFTIAPNDKSQVHLGIIASAVTVIMFGSPLSAMATVLRDKSTDSMHLPLSICGTLCSFSWFLYGFMILEDIFVWFPNMLGFFLSCSQLLLFIVFRKSSSVLPQVFYKK